MKYRKLLLLSPFLLFIVTKPVYSQYSYIASDSSMTSGLKLIIGTSVENAQFVRVKSKDQIKKYTPDVLAEYGFKNGRVYVSKDISIAGTRKKVFLERLVYGQTRLYYYREKGLKIYFLEKNSTIWAELVKSGAKDYRQVIAENTRDCKWISDPARLVSYNSKSLAKLISRYNNCVPRPFPYVKFGLLAGASRTKMIVSSDIDSNIVKNASFEPDNSFIFGLFADLPIAVSNFSLNTGVYFSRNGYSVNSQTPITETDIVINTSTLKIPLLLRYVVPVNKLRPFVNTGGVVSYNIKNSSAIYEATIDQNVITIDEEIGSSLISNTMIGFAGGGGLQYNLDYRRTISLELRYERLFGETNTLGRSEISLLTAINF